VNLLVMGNRASRTARVAKTQTSTESELENEDATSDSNSPTDVVEIQNEVLQKDSDEYKPRVFRMPSLDPAEGTAQAQGQTARSHFNRPPQDLTLTDFHDEDHDNVENIFVDTNPRNANGAEHSPIKATKNTETGEWHFSS
jgi:hypothetical protein